MHLPAAPCLQGLHLVTDIGLDQIEAAAGEDTLFQEVFNSNIDRSTKHYVRGSKKLSEVLVKVRPGRQGCGSCSVCCHTL
jgi:hypothetical protein